MFSDLKRIHKRWRTRWDDTSTSKKDQIASSHRKSEKEIKRERSKERDQKREIKREILPESIHKETTFFFF